MDVKPGDYVFYTNHEEAEIGELGRVVEVCDGFCWVCYHEGGTAASTIFERLKVIRNQQFIKESSFGSLDDRFQSDGSIKTAGEIYGTRMKEEL